MKDKHPVWDVVQTVMVAAVCVSPFWFLAGNLSDGDEMVKTAVSAGLVAVVTMVLKTVNKERKEECDEGKKEG